MTEEEREEFDSTGISKEKLECLLEAGASKENIEWLIGYIGVDIINDMTKDEISRLLNQLKEEEARSRYEEEQEREYKETIKKKIEKISEKYYALEEKVQAIWASYEAERKKLLEVEKSDGAKSKAYKKRVREYFRLWKKYKKLYDVLWAGLIMLEREIFHSKDRKEMYFVDLELYVFENLENINSLKFKQSFRRLKRMVKKEDRATEKFVKYIEKDFKHRERLLKK
ncbi:MAG: hypothetical protein IJB97_02635 [Clostridia bacterium]|nr:hypothetical protein [Clostridia bacterium]